MIDRQNIGSTYNCSYFLSQLTLLVYKYESIPKEQKYYGRELHKLSSFLGNRTR